MKGYRGETNMHDTIEKYGKGSIIQHGKLNDRVYLIKLNKADFPKIISYIENLARTYSYTKIICKAYSWAAPVLVANGFIVESQIPEFYNGKEDVFFMSKFLNSDRLMNLENDKLESLTNELLSFKEVSLKDISSNGFSSRLLDKDNVEDITKIYKKVFKSYPFPIFNPGYIHKTMKDNVMYFGIEEKGKLIALSSSEMDKKGGNAEMTDFATLPKFRGNNLSILLLTEMEKEMKKQNISTLYTIARLNSIAMNKTFLKLKYKYAGTLVKNTNISGSIESMNVYYKHI